jgi:hypothetical protein
MVAFPRNEIFAKRQRTIGLNLGAHFQVALRCGTDRPWLSAERNLVRHRLLEIGREITVYLPSSDIVAGRTRAESCS